MTENLEAAHATYPPSSLGLMERCPGFRNRGGKTEASERGDRVHKALQKDTIEQMVPEERWIAQMCKDYMDGVIAEHRPALPDKDIRERKLNIELHAGVNTFGTPDRLLIYGDMAEVFDYKSGYREVKDAKDNAQAWAYTIGAFQKYPELQTINFYILIPNRDEVFDHTFKREDMPRMILRLNTIIRLAMEFDWSNWEVIMKLRGKLRPGPELCEYCKWATECPALIEKALLASARLGPGLPLPDSMTVDKDRPDDIAKILRLAPLLEAWATEARKKALKLTLEYNLTIPGFKRMTKKTDRAVTSVLGAYNAVKDAVSLQKFLEACGSVSIPSLEQLFKDQAPQGQKTKAARDMETRLRHAKVWADQGDIHYLKEDKK